MLSLKLSQLTSQQYHEIGTVGIILILQKGKQPQRDEIV